MFNGKYELAHTDNIIRAFGLTDERLKEVFAKLNAVANIYPSYVAVAEVWLNADKFTDMEKAFGLFVLGKMFGVGTLINKLKIKISYPIGSPEGELLRKLVNNKKDIDKLLQNILKGK